MAEVAAGLADGYRVLAVDQRGHGGSGPLGVVRPAEFLAAVRPFLDAYA